MRKSSQFYRKYDGKYLGIFDTYEEVEMYLSWLVKYYTSNMEVLSVEDLVNKQRLHGVKITKASFYRILERAGILKQDKKKRVTPLKKFFLNLELPVAEKMQDIPRKTKFFNFVLKSVFGLPTNEILLYFDDNVQVYFYTENSHVRAIVIGDIQDRDENIVRGILHSTKTHGLVAIINFAKTFNYKYLGGTSV